MTGRGYTTIRRPDGRDAAQIKAKLARGGNHLLVTSAPEGSFRTYFFREGRNVAAMMVGAGAGEISPESSIAEFIRGVDVAFLAPYNTYFDLLDAAIQAEGEVNAEGLVELCEKNVDFLMGGCRPPDDLPDCEKFSLLGEAQVDELAESLEQIDGFVFLGSICPMISPGRRVYEPSAVILRDGVPVFIKFFASMKEDGHCTGGDDEHARIWLRAGFGSLRGFLDYLEGASGAVVIPFEDEIDLVEASMACEELLECHGSGIYTLMASSNCYIMDMIDN